MAGQGLAKSERLRGRKRIGELFERGAVGKSRLALARVLPNGLPYARFAAISPKNAGNAVLRNRIRRRLRAVFRTGKETLPKGWDIAVVCRGAAAEANFEELRSGVSRAVTTAVANYRPPETERPCASC